MWSNRWSSMPVSVFPGFRLPDPDSRAFLDYMPGSEIPVIRQPFVEGDLLPYWSMGVSVNDHHLYALKDDPGEDHNLAKGDKGNKVLEKQMIELLRSALTEMEAPDDQFERLGLK
jgi:hypothetical protein